MISVRQLTYDNRETTVELVIAGWPTFQVGFFLSLLIGLLAPRLHQTLLLLYHHRIGRVCSPFLE